MKNKYIVTSEVTKVIIERKNGQIIEFLIDTNVLEKLKFLNSKWYVVACGTNGSFYIMTTFKNKKFYLHRFLMDAEKGEEIDHINRDTLDNRRSNLRKVDRKSNCQNMKPHSNTGLKGVTWIEKEKKYKAQIVVDYKNIYLGRFNNPENAYKVVEEAKRKYGYIDY